MTTELRRAASAFAEELIMHVEDVLENAESNKEQGLALVDQDTKEVVGIVTELEADFLEEEAFRVRLEDGTVLRISVEAYGPRTERVEKLG